MTSKKITAFALASVLALSLAGSHATFASEVTGTLTAGQPTTSTGNSGSNSGSGSGSTSASNSGSISGTVVGGSSQTSSSSSSGGGGGTAFTPSNSNTVLGANDGSEAAGTISPTAGPSLAGTVGPGAGLGAGVSVAQAATNDSAVPALDQGSANGIGLAAQAGGAIPLGSKVAWTIFALLVLLLAGYYGTRYYRSQKAGGTQ